MLSDREGAEAAVAVEGSEQILAGPPSSRVRSGRDGSTRRRQSRSGKAGRLQYNSSEETGRTGLKR